MTAPSEDRKAFCILYSLWYSLHICWKVVTNFNTRYLHYSHTIFSSLKCRNWSHSLLWALFNPLPSVMLEDRFWSFAYDWLFNTFPATLIWWTTPPFEIRRKRDSMIQRDKPRAVRQHQSWKAPTSWLNWPVLFIVDLKSRSVGRVE
jgi:hypothetical protein